MITVKLTTTFPGWPLLRQTPNWSGEWGGCKFLVNDESSTKCDYWVVYDGLLNPQIATCPRENLIFVASEPPPIKHYCTDFLAQFSTVISCDRSIRHPNVKFTQQSLPWMVGVRQQSENCVAVMDYDQLSQVDLGRKTKLLSVITTRKTMTEGHRKRLAFVESLLQLYGQELDVYGRGFKEVEDKWEAIAQYKYHLVLENCRLDDYFTEKLTDAYLGLSYPIYWGCPNLEEYFPQGSFSRIELDDVVGINEILHSGIYEASIDKLEESRRLVLEKYNLFAFLSNMIKDIDMGSKGKPHDAQRVTLFPESYGNFAKIKHSFMNCIKHG